MRSLAEELDNVYIVCMFACCRQIFDPEPHVECFDDAKKNEIKEKLDLV